jgi:glycosyltransferase involved in cell wall biosynthesis
MRVQVVTSLYPSPPRPFEGVFAERRWLGMRARGHEVRVLHPQPYAPWPFATGRSAEIRRMPRHERRETLAIDRPRYFHLPGRARANARRFARCALDALDPQSEVVVCDYAWPASALAPALERRGIPCVVCGRGSDVLEVAGEAGLAAELAANLRAAGAWCAVSGDLVATMDRVAGRPGVGVLVPNGVDTTIFHPRERSVAREHLQLDARAPLVLVVGHLIPRKDPLLALEAFARGAPQDAHLVFVGRGMLEEELRGEIANRGLLARVSLAGERSPAELAHWYAAADLVLLTSRREGRPNVVLEALASGRPVLATDVGGTSELLSDVRMLAPSREASVLARRIGELLATRFEPAELARSVAHLSWEASLSAMERALDGAREHRARTR